MKKILFYNFSGEIDDLATIFPNERLAQLAAITEKEGCETYLWDVTNLVDIEKIGIDNISEMGTLSFDESSQKYKKILDKELERIKKENFDYIFFNFWHGIGFKITTDLIKNLINTKTKIFGIGQKTDWFNTGIFEVIPELKYIIMGLEHESVKQIISGKNVDEINNIIINKNNKEFTKTPRTVLSLEDYPHANYNEKLYKNIDGKIPLFEISLSNQACPNNCSFCVRPFNYGKKTVKRDVKDAVDEIIHLNKKYGAKVFRISDSTPPRKALTEFAKELIKHKDKLKDINISAFSRIDINKEEDFELLKEAGICSLFFGIESLDKNTLIKNKKGTTVSGIKDTIFRAHKAGIYTVGSFIFPFPGETEKSMNNTINHIKDMKEYLDSVLIVPGAIYPTTEWGQNPERFGGILHNEYNKKFTKYPIKYMVPLELWPEFPFSYDLMDKKAEEVKFKDIVSINKKFTEIVRNEIGIPGIPDYYFSISKCINKDPEEFTQETIDNMIKKDYSYFKDLIQKMK